MPADGRLYIELARRAEELRYALVSTGDHVFAYHGIPDALTVLGAWAVSTTRIVLGTGVLLLPLQLERAAEALRLTGPQARPAGRTNGRTHPR